MQSIWRRAGADGLAFHRNVSMSFSVGRYGERALDLAIAELERNSPTSTVLANASIAPQQCDLKRTISGESR
ncbi:hypothetical protein [Variovorax sp. LjRoot178]|uniref:hypothetical protein n=1 Tax=Variovorax sp. LjRoot178 TaxID=3342277 RepID=UPI003ECDAD11